MTPCQYEKLAKLAIFDIELSSLGELYDFAKNCLARRLRRRVHVGTRIDRSRSGRDDARSRDLRRGGALPGGSH